MKLPRFVLFSESFACSKEVGGTRKGRNSSEQNNWEMLPKTVTKQTNTKPAIVVFLKYLLKLTKQTNTKPAVVMFLKFLLKLWGNKPIPNRLSWCSSNTPWNCDETNQYQNRLWWCSSNTSWNCEETNQYQTGYRGFPQIPPETVTKQTNTKPAIVVFLKYLLKLWGNKPIPNRLW